MAKIFISYANEDRERVAQLVNALIAECGNVFWDRVIPAGMTWREIIERTLREAECVVVVWSKHSIKSPYVVEEAEEGKSRKIIVPVFIDKVTLPFGFRHIHAIDLRKWTGQQDGSIKSLVVDVRRVLGIGEVDVHGSDSSEKIEYSSWTQQQAGESSFALATRLLVGQPLSGVEALAAAGDILRPVAPRLQEILASPSVKRYSEAYFHADEEAIVQQMTFLRKTFAANLSLIFAGLLSATALTSPLMEEIFGITLSRYMILMLGVMTLVLGVIANLLTTEVLGNDRMRRWHSSRSTAEFAKGNMFRNLADACSRESSESAGAALALVKHYLIDDSLSWLKAKQHREQKSKERVVFFGASANVLVLLGGCGGFIASFQPSLGWMPLAGVAGAAMAAYTLSRENATGGRLAADRIEKAADGLELLAARLDNVAAALASGHTETLPIFVDAIVGQLATEHKPWLDGALQVEPALTRLDEGLSELGDVHLLSGQCRRRDTLLAKY